MTELQRNMIEQERNMAKQIKEFLDKGIPKADIAKATKFSLEYIDSLLEKFYPQVQLNLLKQQVQILQKKLDNKEFENVQLKQQINTIQAKGANMGENNEPIQTQQAIQKWEYTSARLLNGLEDLNKLGEEGWEVVDGVVLNAGREIVFKRPKQKKPTANT